MKGGKKGKSTLSIIFSSHRQGKWQKVAVSADRTHDLQISRTEVVIFSLTLSQLSYPRLENFDQY